MRLNWVISVIVAAFLALGTIYSITTPLFESYDEAYHFAVVRHIAQGKGLPVLEPGKETLWWQEGGQPPLYYLAAAALTSWINMDDMESLLRHNPHYPHFQAPRNDNRNAYLHTDRQLFPYTGTVLAVHLARFLSLLLGAVAVLFTFLLARTIFPDRKDFALGAMAMVAFNPSFLFLSGAVSNDSLIAALCTMALFGLVRIAQGKGSDQIAFGLGIVLGLALLAKLSALALIPLVVVVLAIAAWRRHCWTLGLRWGGLVFGITFLIAGWWYLRNRLLYGDFLGLQTFLETLGQRDKPVSTLDILPDLRAVELSFWAVFGQGHVLADQIVYDALRILVRLAGFGLLVLGIRQLGRDRLSTTALTGLGVLLLWSTIIFASLIRYMQLAVARNGRLLFPAIAAISILLLLGLVQLVPRRLDGGLIGAVVAGMFVLAAMSPFRYIAPTYARPPIFSQIDEATVPHPLHIRHEDKAELIGYQLQQQTANLGERLHLTLYWRALATMERDYSVYIHLRAQDGQLLGQLDSYRGLGNYPTSIWKPGQVIVDTYNVPVVAYPTDSPVGRVEAGLYFLPTMEQLPATDPAGRAVIPVIGLFKVASPALPHASAPGSTMQNLGGQIALVRHEFPANDLQPGQSVRLILYWSALIPLERDYTVFSHLEDQEGRLWAQDDSWPREGTYPTSFWDVGEIVQDQREIRLPTDIPPGEYSLLVGVYFLPTGERLPLRGEGGEYLDDKICLGTVRIVGR